MCEGSKTDSFAVRVDGDREEFQAQGTIGNRESFVERIRE